MKKLFYICLSLLPVLGLTACDEDGDFLTTNGAGNVTLDGNSGAIVLDKDNINNLALTVYWTDNGELTISNPLVAAPKNATVNTVQFSGTEDFATVVEQEADKGVYEMQFTHYELNNIVGRLGFEGGVATPLYVRVESVLGANLDPSYSNVLSFTVTSYELDMTVGAILDSSQVDTGLTLSSPDADGVYYGFVGASGWYNWYLQEGDGTIWGNDGDTGTPFQLSTASTKWNFWYPGTSGCYWTIVDTNAAEWSALLISSLNISGDVTGEMTYDRQQNQWVYTYTAASAGTVNVTISGTGTQYNISTGADASDLTTSVGFGQSGGSITFDAAGATSTISVDVASAGEVSIVLNLSNPKEWTCTASSGSVTPTEIAQYVYLSGVDDGISGSWTFDNYLRLCNEDDLRYGGACNVNSLWGYRIYTEVDNWVDYYAMADGGTALSGTLVYGGENNITAPDAGLYVFNVSLKDLSYNLTAVTSVSFTGLNDDWTFTSMTETSTGIYTGTLNVTQVSSWGFQIIINDDWNTYFGGSDGSLYLFGSNITDDATLGVGTYTLTVDLCKGTYTIE